MNVIESRCFQTRLMPEGYLHTLVAAGAEIGVEDARRNTEAVNKLSQNNLYPILVDLRTIKSISKEARDHFAMRGRKPGVSAIAMLVASPVSRIVGNFFLGLNRPTVPTRLFTSEKEAINWSLQYATGKRPPE